MSIEIGVTVMLRGVGLKSHIYDVPTVYPCDYKLMPPFQSLWNSLVRWQR